MKPIITLVSLSTLLGCLPASAQTHQRAAAGGGLAEPFKQMDRNGDGKVNREEGGSLPFFDAADKDKDGSLTDAELRAYSAARESGRPTAEQPVQPPTTSSVGSRPNGIEPEVPQRFRLFDKNKDLRITRDELTAHPNIFTAVDANKDGVITPAEFEEFESRLFKSRRGKMQHASSIPSQPPLVTRNPDGVTAYWPGTETWDTVSPADLGWNETALKELLDYVASKNTGALIILHGGRIVVERYWNGWDETQRDTIASAAKSITSVLVGIAQDRKRLNVDDPVSKHLGMGWSKAPPEKETRITIRHLLSMTSGLDEDLAYVTEAVQKWEYNNTAYHVTWKVIEAATGQTLDAFTAEVLWKPLGMAYSDWSVASHTSNARDCARFGLMVLRQGEWRGQRIVSADYLRESTKSSQPMNPAYGWLWWLNGTDKYTAPGVLDGSGPLVPPAPADMIAALGRFDRKIYVVPSRDLVVVRMGEGAGVKRDALSSFDRDLWQRLVNAIPSTTAK